MVIVFLGKAGGDLFSTALLSVSFAQAGLLAIAASLTASRPLGILAIFVGLIIGMCLPFLLMFLLCANWTIRGFDLRRFPPGDPPPHKPLRFSLRELFLIVAATGLFMAAANWVRLHTSNPFLIGASIAGALMVSMPSVSLWAVLGQGHVGQRSGILLLVSTAIGLLAHAFAGVGPSPAWFWPLVLNLQAAIMILSLLVVRSCGYRLVRLQRPCPRM